MDILFCDLCNESVPLADVQAGRAYYRKERLICADCDRAMSGVEPAGTAVVARPELGSGPGQGSPTSASAVPDALPEGGLATASRPQSAAGSAVHGAGSAVHGAGSAVHGAGSAVHGAGVAPRGGTGSGAGGVVVGLLALAVAGGGLWVVTGRLDELGVEARRSERALEQSIAVAERDHEVFVAGLPARFSDSEQRVHARQEEARRELLAAVEGLRSELRESGAREEAVARELASLRDELDKQDTSGRERFEGMKAELLSMEKDMRFYSDRLIELEETLRTLSARPPVAGAGVPAGGAPGAPPAPTTKAWEGLLADLSHESAGIRLDAIYALGETGDPAVVPHLIPMLADVDLFVRMATARMLEDLDARPAVPALIDALEDAQSAVREAAMVALRRITGKDFQFEPVASEAERSKKVKVWRDWWKKNGDEFLAGS